MKFDKIKARLLHCCYYNLIKVIYDYNTVIYLTLLCILMRTAHCKKMMKSINNTCLKNSNIINTTFIFSSIIKSFFARFLSKINEKLPGKRKGKCTPDDISSCYIYTYTHIFYDHN